MRTELVNKDEYVQALAFGIAIGYGIFTFITLTNLLIKFMG